LSDEYSHVEEAFPNLSGRDTSKDVRFRCPSCGTINGGTVYLESVGTIFKKDVQVVVCGACWKKANLTDVQQVNAKNEVI
jgi:transcription elongation factor Elf1